jgi:monothiol glutaredoxin
MPRPVLDASRLHPAIRDTCGQGHADLIREVDDASRRHAVVVVGMAGNPFVKRARRALDAQGVAHHDIDVGGYLSLWRRRNALKMWTGWPTFPMVFVRGCLVGGCEDLQRLIDRGELRSLLDAPGAG